MNTGLKKEVRQAMLKQGWRGALLLLLVISLGVCEQVEAEPMMSNAEDILSSSPLVVIGTLRDGPKGTIFIEVARILRDDGKVAPGPQLPAGLRELSAIDTPEGTVGVFFLDSGPSLQYVAAPPADLAVPLNKLAEAPLEMKGFYAFNAHLVVPALVSLASIEGALKTGTFVDVVELSVAFPSEHGWLADPALTYSFTVENGASKSASGPMGSISASLSSWNHTVHMNVESTAGHALSLGGRLMSAKEGRLQGIVIPTDPTLTTAQAFSTYLADGSFSLELEVEIEGKTAPLTLTGSVEGVLGKGLATTGTFASIRRTHKGGHRSQYGEDASSAEAPHLGWNVEIKTSLGPLWLTLDLDEVDALIPKGFEDGLSLQSLLVSALYQNPLDFKASGALSGSGTLRVR